MRLVQGEADRPLRTPASTEPAPPAPAGSFQDREAAFQGALEIGEGGQSGGEEETRRRTRWVETQLAEVVALDCLCDELEDEPLEVHWVRLPATEKIAFDHKFEPAKRVPAAVG